ncbi:hypothetical protein PENTCL1PPCAC_15694 [Pristionchus entomophagus]|uniref:Uncharacterized protein n=1 Tax=Pristionchus entomophagus TaxID=358040 RepID=A0AAV5TGK6_9BILA|nr:hypothetical protein PENTCL1PPCAC_15694 [Pristionchus entomophagus]
MSILATCDDSSEEEMREDEGAELSLAPCDLPNYSRRRQMRVKLRPTPSLSLLQYAQRRNSHSSQQQIVRQLPQQLQRTGSRRLGAIATAPPMPRNSSL